MTLDSPQRRVSPRALTGRILAINGAVFVVVGALIGGYVLLTSTSLLALKLLAPIFLGIGLLELLVGLVLWLLPGGQSPASTVANQYYTALEQQDYLMAFQCLDPLMGSPLSEPITQARFSERAQAYDAEHGRVVSYALTGVQANPGQRLYTIKVTRASGTYKTRLHVAKQGYDWKITGFDRF